MRFLRELLGFLVPSDEQMTGALPQTLAEHREHQRRVEENRVIALKALERIHGNTTPSPIRRSR